MPEQVDVLVVGAGQAGLAMGYYLRQQPLRFVIVDGAPRLGNSWRTRYDSLRLFTPTQFHLPGLPFPGPARYPTRDEVADYLEQYARTFDLPVRLGCAVRALRRAGNGYRVETDGGAYLARQVVIATGPFQRPHIPALAAGLSPGVCQVHSSQYRSPASCSRARCWWWGQATPACRLPKS